MQIHKIQICIYTWIFVAVRLVTYLRYIPSQTLVVIRPTKGQRSRTDFCCQAEKRLFTSIPIHITMDPCNFIISCHSHSSKYSDTECHGLYINSTTIQNTITTLSLWTPPNQFVTAQFLLSIPNAVYEQQESLTVFLHTVLRLSVPTVFGQGYSVTVGRVIKHHAKTLPHTTGEGKGGTGRSYPAATCLN